jgi:hypothetical protein
VRLRWKKDARATGLSAVCAAPRGAELKADGVCVGSVSANPIGFHEWHGWYWAGIGRAHPMTHLVSATGPRAEHPLPTSTPQRPPARRTCGVA